MKFHNSFIVLFTVLLLGSGTTATAATDDTSANKAQDLELQAQLESEYRKALLMAEKERQAAEVSTEKAHKQLQLAAEQRSEAAVESTRASAAREAEMAQMHKELNHARRNLREASREIARVDREVAQARASSEASRFEISTSERPVIGVILGAADDAGIEVLGVSPDGPSERAGITPGDVIVALGGRVLTTVDQDGDARNGLNMALKEIRALEPLVVSVKRGDETLDLTVVPEIREPLTWQTITRFPTAPEAPGVPGKVISIERVVVPEIDTEALAEQIKQMRIEVDERRMVMEAGHFAPHDREYKIELHEMSELGDFALHDANVWFGLPLTQGLKLAEIDPGLGEYFKTDRGVLVLKAKADNDLQLKSGDVILQLGDKEVNSPAEFVRALREFQSGAELVIDIKRKRKNQTLTAVMPDSQTSFFAPQDGKTHTIKIISTQD